MSIEDRISGKSFLIDSGADECVYPASNADRSLHQTACLRAANGSKILSFGKQKLQLSFAPGHLVCHEFWIAKVSRPILGCDFFLLQNLVIDVPRQRLLGPGKVFQTQQDSTPTLHGIHCPPLGPFEQILRSSPSSRVSSRRTIRQKYLTRGNFLFPPEVPQYMLEQEGLMARSWRWPGQSSRKWKILGIVQRFDSPWASPLPVSYTHLTLPTIYSV